VQGGDLVSGEVSLVSTLWDQTMGGNLQFDDSHQVTVVEGLYPS